MEFELWDELRAMERRMDDLFRVFLGPRARTLFPALPAGVRQPFLPAMDVYGKDGSVAVRLELPGLDPAKDVSVTIEDGDLVVRGERRRTKEVKEEDYYRMESSYGAFERRIPMPEGIVEKDIKPEYRDGILEIVVPAVHERLQPAKAKARSIPIKTAKVVKAA